MSVVRFLTVSLILGLSLGLLGIWSGADALSSSGNAAYLLYLIGLVVLVVVISSVTRLRGIGALALAVIVAVIGYAYRFELQGSCNTPSAHCCPIAASRSGRAA
jgi:hypothetical protein